VTIRARNIRATRPHSPIPSLVYDPGDPSGSLITVRRVPVAIAKKTRVQASLIIPGGSRTGDQFSFEIDPIAAPTFVRMPQAKARLLGDRLPCPVPKALVDISAGEVLVKGTSGWYRLSSRWCGAPFVFVSPGGKVSGSYVLVVDVKDDTEIMFTFEIVAPATGPMLTSSLVNKIYLKEGKQKAAARRALDRALDQESEAETETEAEQDPDDSDPASEE
jgi:hypothetical protein